MQKRNKDRHKKQKKGKTQHSIQGKLAGLANAGKALLSDKKLKSLTG
jgi:hypothetical protein